MRVVDTGVGMTPIRFRQAMRSIGSSLKGIIEPNRLTKKYGRPIIGHLGIRLMALSQVCSKARIESPAEGSKTKFIAEIDFSEFKNRGTDKIRLDVLRKGVKKFGDERQMTQLLKNAKTDIDKKIEIEETLDLISRTGATLKQPEELEKEHLGYCIL